MAYQPELEKLQRQYQDDPARVFAQLADVYRRGGRIDEAVAMLREHLEARPNYVSGLIVLGRCLLDQRNDAEARETFERVIAIDREHIIALRALGEIGERSGDPGGARLWYQRLLEIDPMNEEAEAALGRLASAPAAAAPPPAPVPPAPPPAPPLVKPAAPRPPEARTAEVEPPARKPEPEEPLVVERMPDEPEAAPWVPRPRADHERAPTFEDAGEASPAAGPPAGGDDVSGWIEHPEELLQFEEGAGARETPAEGEFVPFDDSLGWGAGERVSRQISESDLEEAEASRAEDLSAAVQGLPGLEDAAPPAPEDVAEAMSEAPVEGLQQVEYDTETAPLEGLEPDDAMMPPAASVPPGQPPVARPPLAGLPVIFPGDMAEEAAEEPLRVEPRPEPVVTETMAELYARQGLVGEARETYRQLLATRPHDRRLAARLAELQESGPGRDARAVYDALATGGQTARAFLGDILGGRFETAVESPPADLEPEASGNEAAPAVEPEPMERAFGEDTPEPRGAPAHPAPDEISLAAVFGEPASPIPAAPAPPGDEPARSPGGFSFDEFFSGRTPDAEAPPARTSRDTMADDEGEEAFRDWLKGLKS
jgi:tetratricopeptide (TPR) repeat protein